MPAVRTPVTILVLAALALFVAACSGQGPDPKQMVLRGSDLPWDSVQTSYSADNAHAAKDSGAAVADYVRWGRISGYEAHFGRRVTGTPLVWTGILQLQSSASTYETAKGAAAATRAAYAAVGKTPRTWRFQRVALERVPMRVKIGDEARLFLASTKEEDDGWREGRTWKFYVVLWRYGTVTATLTASGANPRLDEMVYVGADFIDAPDVLRLARKQQARIATALA